MSPSLYGIVKITRIARCQEWIGNFSDALDERSSIIAETRRPSEHWNGINWTADRPIKILHLRTGNEHVADAVPPPSTE